MDTEYRKTMYYYIKCIPLFTICFQEFLIFSYLMARKYIYAYTLMH